MPKIYVLSGPDIGRTFEVEDGAKLGRAIHCSVHLRDVSVSREHAKLVRVETGWRVVDTGSRNGVSVGGSKVPSAPLEDGSEFLIGEVLLRFRSDAVAVKATEPVSSPPRASQVEDAPDEIVIEEDPLAALPAPAQAVRTPAPGFRSTAPGVAGQPAEVGASADGLSAAPDGSPAAPSRIASEFERTMFAKPHREATVQRGRGILQYKKIPERSGLFASDLSQQPLWVRLGAGLLAIALFAAIFLFAFKGTSFLKGKAAGGGTTMEDGEDR